MEKQLSKLPYPRNLISLVKGEEFTGEITKDMLDGLEYVLSQLRDIERLVIKKKFEEHCSIKEIAETIGLAPSSVSGKAFQCIINMRKVQKHKGYYYIVYGLEGGEKERQRIASEFKEEVQPKDRLAIDNVGLSVRTQNCLRRNGVEKLDEVKSIKQLKVIRNMGDKSVKEVVDKMQELGLELREEE